MTEDTLNCKFEYVNDGQDIQCSRCKRFGINDGNPPERHIRQCKVIPKIPERHLPPLKQQAVNFIKASLLYNFTGRKKASKEEYEFRIQTCGNCHHRLDDRCTRCGCYIYEKAKQKHQKCPLGKWKHVPGTMDILFRNNKEPSGLQGIYKGYPAFLCLAGPSIKTLDLSRIHQRGILKAAVNNIAAAIVYPNIWFSVDDPDHFSQMIWQDPTILKVILADNHGKKINIWHDNTLTAGKRIWDMPNVYYGLGNKDFCVDTFFTEQGLNWGNDKEAIDAYGLKGGRSVMLVALKVLWFLGISRVYLLGCDFQMREEEPYAFEQEKNAQKCASNNSSYYILNERLTHLRPVMEQNGMQVFNCNPDSKLKAFDYRSYDDAVKDCQSKCPQGLSYANMYKDLS